MKTIYSCAFICFFLVGLSAQAQVNPTTPPTVGSAATNGLSAAESAVLEAASNALQVATFVVLTNELELVSPPALSPSSPTTAPATDPSTSGATTLVIATNALQPVTVTLLQSQPWAMTSTVSPGLAAGGMSPLDALGGCVQPPSGLVGWWRAEGNALDTAGSNAGQRIGGDTYGGGEVGQAFLLDGSSQYVSLTNLATPNFTMEGWIHPNSQVAWQAFIMGQSYGRQMILQASGSSLCVAIYITTTGGSFYGLWDSNDPIPIGAWTHLAATWDGTYLRLYLNGSQKAWATPGFSSIGDTGCNFSIGASGSCAPSQYFPGLIDEMSLYSRALSSNEIAAIVQAGSAGKCPPQANCATCPASAVAWWPGEQTGSDVLGGHDGTPQNSPGFVSGEVGDAFNFTGSNSVQVANSGLIYASWSIEAWINPAVSISAQAFIFGQGYGRQLIVQSGNTVAVAITPDGYTWRVLPSDPITIGQWTHVVAAYDAASGTLSLYVNGGGRQSTPGVVPWDSGCAWSMGGLNNACGASGQWFSGAVDEVTLYSSALTLAQVQAIYSAGAAGKCRALTPLEAWLQSYFGPGFRTDPNAALGADPDTDGLTNFQEYILGTNPIQAAVPDDGTINLQVYTAFK
jgi:hypothetical protein